MKAHGYTIEPGADLRGANLTGANLTGANLSGANLTGANLSGANLRDVKGLPKAPIIPDLDARILAAIEAPGNALEMHDWHSCETAHCRAGWAVVVAGAEGADLERQYGPSVAGALLYLAAGRTIVPNWVASNEDALADIRRGAERTETNQEK